MTKTRLSDPLTSLDYYCNELKGYGTIIPLSDEETHDIFREFELVTQQLELQKLSEAICPKSRILYNESVVAVKEKRQKNIITRITTSCLPYVLKLAKDFARGSNSRDLLVELIAGGNVGLCRAVWKYRHESNVPFRIYAAFWMKADFMIIMKAHHSLVKSRDNLAKTVYIDDSSADRASYLADSLDVYEDALVGSLEGVCDNTQKATLQAIEELPAVQQWVYRMRNKLCTLPTVRSKSHEFTTLTKTFRANSASFVKKIYSESVELLMASISGITSPKS